MTAEAEQQPLKANLQITMLGGFRISVGEKTVDESLSRARRLWNLLQYLIAYRDKEFSQEALLQALWPKDEIENPAGALKNLVYRIRTTLLAQQIPYAKEMIYSHQESYRWNNSLDCVVDTEEFERLATAAKHAPRSERAALCEAAIARYTGDFLPNARAEAWVIPLAEHYRNLYFDCVYWLAELLQEAKQWMPLQALCEKATVFDPFAERAQGYVIHAMVKQGQSAAALERYRKVDDLFYRELGTKPSDALRKLYREITKSVNQVEMDLNVIKEDLNEKHAASGAFYCDYEVFKNLYRMEARASARSGQAMWLALLTLMGGDERDDKQIYTKTMDQLLAVIQNSLRKGDVVSRFSATQYVLMLPSPTCETARTVLDRVEKNFSLRRRSNTARLHTVLRPFDQL